MDAPIPADHENMSSVPQPMPSAAGVDAGDVAYLLRQIVTWITDVAVHASSNREFGHDD